MIDRPGGEGPALLTFGVFPDGLPRGCGVVRPNFRVSPGRRFAVKTVEGSVLIEKLGMGYLRQVSVFGALSEAGIEFLMTRGRILQLDAGEVLYEPGDRGDCFYVVLQGSLSFYQQHEGQLAHVRDLEVGEEMGFCAMIALHDRVGRPVAAGPCLVLEVTSGQFYDLHEERPTDFGLLLLNLARGMARTLRDVSDHVAEQALRQRRAAG